MILSYPDSRMLTTMSVRNATEHALQVYIRAIRLLDKRLFDMSSEDFDTYQNFRDRYNRVRDIVYEALAYFRLTLSDCRSYLKEGRIGFARYLLMEFEILKGQKARKQIEDLDGLYQRQIIPLISKYGNHLLWLCLYKKVRLSHQRRVVTKAPSDSLYLGICILAFVLSAV